ncbi:MAG: TlyA family RNA methyltransferase [Chloroflexi bacterium]|nr:TlyA family RNA methyltransferase [Chloroflexota bacterium]
MSPRSNKTRLDELLVELGHAADADTAARMVMAGRVKLSGSDAAAVLTPGMRVSSDAEVTVAEPPRFVSRGGLKLERGLDEFGIDVTGMVALDLGASTGGFTDCLLQRGAKRVYAVDSGRAQLHTQLIADSRVISMERTNARKGFTLPEKVRVIVADLSFISLLAVLPQNMEHLEPDGHCVVLLKPQFEAERREVPRGGVIEDPATVDAIIERFRHNAAALGLEMAGIVESPVRGDRGNREFLVRIVRAGAR